MSFDARQHTEAELRELVVAAIRYGVEHLSREEYRQYDSARRAIGRPWRLKQVGAERPALTQRAVEAALLTLKPWPAEWYWGRIFNGVHVTRLDRPGAWFLVGLYDPQSLVLMDAAHAVRLGPGKREEQTRGCIVCSAGKRLDIRFNEVNLCVPCCEFVCRDCWNDHRATHADYYAELAAWVDAGAGVAAWMPSESAPPSEREPMPKQRAPEQQELFG